MAFARSSAQVLVTLGVISILLVVVEGKIWLNTTGAQVWGGTCVQTCTAAQPCSFPQIIGNIGGDCEIVFMSGFPMSLFWGSQDRKITLSTNGPINNRNVMLLGSAALDASYVVMDRFEMNTTAALVFVTRNLVITNSTFISSGIDGEFIFKWMFNTSVTSSIFQSDYNSVNFLTGIPEGPTVVNFTDVSFNGPPKGFPAYNNDVVTRLSLKNVSISNTSYFGPYLANTTILREVKDERNDSRSFFNACDGWRLEIYDSILNGLNFNASTSISLTDTLIIDKSKIGGNAFAISVKAPHVSISDSTFSTTAAVTFGTPKMSSTSNVVLSNTTFSRSDFGIADHVSYIGLLSNGPLINLDISNIQFIDPFDPLEDCQWTLNGSINLVSPLIAESICLPYRTSTYVSGSPLEIKASLDTIGSGPLTSTLYTTSSSSLTLHPIHIGSNTTFSTFDGNFTYVPDHNDPTNGMKLKSSNFPPCTANVEWRGPNLPPISVNFTLANGTRSLVSVVSSDPSREIGATFNAIDSEVTFQYLPQECNSMCNFNHTTVGPGENCESTVVCPCQSEFGGDYCGCSTVGLFGPFECSSSEENTWVVKGDYTLPNDTQLVLPPSYHLIVWGNFQVDGGLIFQGSSSLTVTKQLIVNGIINATFYLLEREVEGGCVVYPEMHIESETLLLEELAQIDLVIDISQLSGNCTFLANNTLEIADSLFYSLSGTSTNANTKWNVQIVDRRPNKKPIAPVEISLVNSKNKTSSIGTTTLLTATTSDPSSCTSFSSSPGILSVLIVPCETPNPNGSPSKKRGGVKWYYYAIPLIAVGAITVAVGAVILKNRGIQRTILPYRGAF